MKTSEEIAIGIIEKYSILDKNNNPETIKAIASAIQAERDQASVCSSDDRIETAIRSDFKIKTDKNDPVNAFHGQRDFVSKDGDYRGNSPQTKWGLTKREYFAAMAMQGLLSDPNIKFNIEEISVKFADKLIEELNK